MNVLPAAATGAMRLTLSPRLLADQLRSGARSFRPAMRHLAVAALLAAGTSSGYAAAGDDPGKPEKPVPSLNKLTVAYYDFSSDTIGFDINLRHTFKTSTAWIGVYRESSGFDQGRVGYEYDYHGAWLTLVPSVQAATHDFLGASV